MYSEYMENPNNPNDITGLDESRLYAALSYLFILVLVPLFMKRDDAFVMYHAKQGLVVMVGYVLAMIAVNWVSIIGNLLWLVLMIVSVVGVIQAAQGKRWRIPVISDIADKFSL